MFVVVKEERPVGLNVRLGRPVMALEIVNYIALAAGVLLLSCSGYRPQLWSHGNDQRSFEERSRMTRRDESRSDQSRVRLTNPPARAKSIARARSE